MLTRSYYTQCNRSDSRSYNNASDDLAACLNDVSAVRSCKSKRYSTEHKRVRSHQPSKSSGCWGEQHYR